MEHFMEVLGNDWWHIILIVAFSIFMAYFSPEGGTGPK
jgi:hypothetical protein